LSLEEQPEKDFSAGLFKWLEIASRKHPPGETASVKKCDKAELFTRLSVVSEQVHGLYLVLKELRKSLESRGFGFKNSFQSELIGSFFDGKDATKEMLRHIALKLHSLEAVIPGELRVKSFPDFPPSREVGINPENAGKKRVRSERRRATPKSKKKKLQSKRLFQRIPGKRPRMRRAKAKRMQAMQERKKAQRQRRSSDQEETRPTPQARITGAHEDPSELFSW